ncbi:phosphatidylinositol transfer protein 1-like isoform X2 [Juglans microcarpa x Juglans regia]|uniref:phosphatidylinositol transfer protein 1-like isoform X2 n=1 Tax=Juglans microcarpa x Juglans regia TaxID=2249226 RepID=UPI001B7F644F|nr:phosphatidylinositol transfer protein 1-like isoform X2 [Juglans microcarpa x Juglans regia]
MGVIKEFRIVMPLSLEEYGIAQMYMVTKMQQKNTTGTERVELLESRPFEDDVYGKGRYTSKVYRLQSKVPAWLRKFAPPHALDMQEEAWSAYPRCKSGLPCPLDIPPCVFLVLVLMSFWFFICKWMPHYPVLKCAHFTRFRLTIETVHRADNGHSENVHGLSKEQLAARQVEYIDIAIPGKDCWSYLVGNCSIDFSKFKSARIDRGPLPKGWQDRRDPVMTAYKLVTIDAPYWGFGRRLEQALLAGERALFLESHRHCFGWIDEWYGMTVQQIDELLQPNDSTLNEGIVKPALMMSIEHFRGESPLDGEGIYSKKSEVKSQQSVS